MTIRVGINGFGRMGRLALRAAWGFDAMQPESLRRPCGVWGDGHIEIVHVNEVKGGADTAAHLLAFDSVHGRWPVPVEADKHSIRIADERLSYSTHDRPGDVPWRDLGVDLVLECSGKFRTPETLQPYFDGGVAKVIVAAPVRDDTALNIVMGVNDDLYDADRHHLLSAARFFLFGARDIRFIVGVPIFLYEALGWSFMQVGGRRGALDVRSSEA